MQNISWVMVKRSLYIIGIFFTTAHLNAQTLSSSVLPSAGGSTASDGVQLNFTVGQSFMPVTFSGGSAVITQGFQQPELQIWTGSVNNIIYPGSNTIIPFKASGIVSRSNIYTAELSDKNGSFDYAVVIGTSSGNQNGEVPATIPPYALPGTQYRVRVRSSASPFKGIDNGVPLTLKSKLIVSASPNPSANYFNLAAQGTFDEPVEIKVVNQLGNVIETRKGMPAKGNLQIGMNYRPGIYFVEFTQGGEKVVIKLDKLSN